MNLIAGVQVPKPRRSLVVEERNAPIVPKIRYLAKTSIKNGVNGPGKSVYQHCLEVGLVARELITLFPDHVIKLCFPKGTELVCALHDVGKIYPAFQEKIYHAINKSLELGELNNDILYGGHALVSEVTILPFDTICSRIVGRHHGYFSNISKLGNGQERRYGGEAWHEERLKTFNTLKKILKCELPKGLNDDQVQVISGIVTVSDWIASNETLLNGSATQVDPSLAAMAVKKAGFSRIDFKSNLTFENINQFKPYPFQAKFCDQITSPGIYILEAPMGSGKTEMALYASYQLISKGLANGIYFGLPTQLTSDKIYERMISFLDQVSNTNGDKIQLAHGSAWMRNVDMGATATVGQEWFDSSKRKLLANIAVGTIDQALMSVMNVKHGFVRSFGLSGKVVILDEVHSYDAYTNLLMVKLIHHLKNMGCTVIVLSATLTNDQVIRLSAVKSDYGTSYPRLTKIVNEEMEIIEIDSNEPILSPKTFQVRIEEDTEKAIEKAISKAILGEQVLWIENTVQSAIDIFIALKSINGDIEIGLLHSKFTPQDRGVIEEKWIRYYGKNNQKARDMKGRILIGTQILEQSIDIDADYMISRICPTDMLLQRMGRLWRHKKNIRKDSANREILVLTPTLEKALSDIQTVGHSIYVYSEYILLRTIEVLESCQEISLPKDIRGLLERTYSDREEIESWRSKKEEVADRFKMLTAIAKMSLSDLTSKIPESQVSTRFSEDITVKILIVLEFNQQEIIFLDGSKFNLASRSKDSISLEIQKRLINCSKKKTGNEQTSDRQLLSPYVYIPKDQENKAENDSLFRIYRLTATSELLTLSGQKPISSKKMSYTSSLGLQTK